MPPKTKLCLLIAQQCRTLYTLTFFHCTNSSILFTNGHVFSSSKTAWISKSRERVREQIITTFLLQMGNRLVKERGCVGGVGQQVTLQVQYRGTAFTTTTISSFSSSQSSTQSVIANTLGRQVYWPRTTPRLSTRRATTLLLPETMNWTGQG